MDGSFESVPLQQLHVLSRLSYHLPENNGLTAIFCWIHMMGMTLNSLIRPLITLLMKFQMLRKMFFSVNLTLVEL